MFEPGKPMPRAGVVAAMRQQVADLKNQLATLMAGGAEPAALAASDEELAERARQAFMEVERLLGPKGRSAHRDDGAAIAVLEAENERLRLEATALLLRQQQLEELLEEHMGTGGGGGNGSSYGSSNWGSNGSSSYGSNGSNN